MLQAICNCGRIAEVRHQKNGSNLAYTYCKVCKTGARSLANSELVKAAAQEDIGEFGEFPNKTTPDAKSNATGDWVPDSETTPEALEENSENSENETERKTSKGKGFFGFVLGGLAVCGLSVFGYNVVKNKRG